MAPTSKQLEKIKKIEEIAQQWLNNYEKYDLKTEASMSAAFPQIKDAHEKAAFINSKYSGNNATLEKSSEKEAEASNISDNTPNVDTNNPLNAWGSLETLWGNLNIAAIAEGKFSLDSAKGLLSKVNSFISTANLVLTVVSKISILAAAANTAKEWIATAQSAVEKIQLALDLLEEYSELLSKFNSLKEALSVDKLSEFKLSKMVQEVKGYFSTLDNFKNFLSKIPGASKELADAQNWRESLTALVKSAGGIIEEAIKDEDGNGLPDWYDKINAKLTDITGLLPSSLTAAIPADVLSKIESVKKEVEQFLAAATKAGEAGKNFIEKVSGTMATIEKSISAVKGLTDALKNKDWKSAYDQIQVLWKEVQSMATTLNLNTKIDDVLAKIDTLKNISDSWLGTFLPSEFTEIVEQINNVKNIVNSLTTIAQEVKTFAEAVKNKDWATIFQSLKKAYTAIVSGKDLVAGTDIDNQLVAKAQDILKQIEDFIKQTTGLEGTLGMQIAQAKDMVVKINGIIAKGKELVTAVKEGDWKTIYDSIKDAYTKLDTATGFIPGTNIDDEIIANAQKLKAQMEEFIKNKLGGNTGDLFQAIEEIKGLYAKVSSFPEMAQDFIDNIKEGNWFTVFEQIKSAYLALGKIEDLTKLTNLDDKVLAKVHSLQKSVDDFMAKVTGVSGLENQIEQLKTWKSQITNILAIGKDIVNDFANKDIKSGFNKLLNAWNQIQQIPGATDGTGLDDKVLAQVQKLQGDVDNFLSTYSKGDITSVQGLIDKAKEIQSGVKTALSFVNTIKGNIENKEFGTALSNILNAWNDINKKTNNLIPGTNIDDKILEESRALQAKLEEFVTKFSGGALSGDIPQMIEQVKQYASNLQTFISDAAFIIDAIKSGDTNRMFDALKKQWDIIEKLKGDILPGTTIDTKIYEKVKSLLPMATEFLQKAVGADTDAKKQVVNDWINIGKNIISYFISKEPIPSLEHLNKDTVVVSTPQNVQLSETEEAELLEKITAGKTGTLAEKLIHALDNINIEIGTMKSKLELGKSEAINKQLGTVTPVVETKKYFDAVMKKQKVVTAILTTLGTVIQTTVTTFLIPAGPAAAIVPVVFKLLKGFDNVGSALSSIQTSNGTANMAIQLLGSFLNSNTTKTDTNALFDISKELEAAYRKLVEDKYNEIITEVVNLNNTIVKAKEEIKNKDEAGIKKLQSQILIYAHQWASVKGQIESVYLNSESTKVNNAALVRATKRVLYMDWLINNKDISLVKEIVADLNEIGITAEAGVDLTNSVGAKIARGLGQMFGKLLSFGESGKIEALKAHALKNISTVQQKEFASMLAA